VLEKIIISRPPQSAAVAVILPLESVDSVLMRNYQTTSCRLVLLIFCFGFECRDSSLE